MQVAVLSINRDLAPFFWRECAGVIGYDFISRFVVRVDYDHHRLTLTDPDDVPVLGRRRRAIPFTLAGTMPAIRMTLDGRYTGEFRVDVGSSSTVDLHAPFVRQNRLDDPGRTALEVTGGGFGGTFSSRLTRMKTLEIGKFSWPRPIVSFSGAMAGALASEDYAGNIGNQILERFTCTVRLRPSRALSRARPGLRPSPTCSRDPASSSRATATPSARCRCCRDRAAAAAGLREGDEVVTLLGKPILSFKPDDLTELFEARRRRQEGLAQVARDGKKKPLDPLAPRSLVAFRAPLPRTARRDRPPHEPVRHRDCRDRRRSPRRRAKPLARRSPCERMRPAPLVDRASPELVHDEPPAESTRPSAFDFAGVVVPVTETRASPAKEVLSSSAVSSLLHQVPRRHRLPEGRARSTPRTGASTMTAIRRIPGFKTLRPLAVRTALALLAAAAIVSPAAAANQYRYAHLTWEPGVATNAVEFTLIEGFKRTAFPGPPNVGDIINDPDGVQAPVRRRHGVLAGAAGSRSSPSIPQTTG